MRRMTVLSLAVAIAIAFVVVQPAASEVRLDIGVMVPRGAGLTLGGSTTTTLGENLGSWPFIPLPEAGIYYQGDLGMFKLGIGARAYSVILETILWPNAFAELDLGKVAIEAQIGGGAFLMLGMLPTEFQTGKVFIPDVSAWFKIGKKGNFRLGGGMIGLYATEAFGDAMPFLFYLGGKASLLL
jgi:hypothetical protein